MKVDFSSLRDTYNELVADVEFAKNLDADCCSEDFIKRTYTRAFFALVEGVIFQLKVIALAANKETNVFDPFEVELLQEKEVYLADNGIAKRRKAKLRLLPNLIFSINSAAKSLKLDFSLHKEHLNQEQGWAAMKDAVEIRDRITHPKHKECLSITDNDIYILGQANAWFRDEIVKLINLMRETHEIY
jgi:hypothetical protein